MVQLLCKTLIRHNYLDEAMDIYHGNDPFEFCKKQPLLDRPCVDTGCDLNGLSYAIE